VTREEIPAHMLEGIDDLGLDLEHMSRAAVAEEWLEWSGIQGWWSTIVDLVGWAHAPARQQYCYVLRHPDRPDSPIFELAVDAMAAAEEEPGVWTLQEWGWSRGEWRVVRLEYRPASM